MGGRGLVTVTTHSSASPARNTGPRLSSATTSIMAALESDLKGNKGGQRSVPWQGGCLSEAWGPGPRRLAVSTTLSEGSSLIWRQGTADSVLPTGRASLRAPDTRPSRRRVSPPTPRIPNPASAPPFLKAPHSSPRPRTPITSRPQPEDLAPSTQEV